MPKTFHKPTWVWNADGTLNTTDYKQGLDLFIDTLLFMQSNTGDYKDMPNFRFPIYEYLPLRDIDIERARQDLQSRLKQLTSSAALRMYVLGSTLYIDIYYNDTTAGAATLQFNYSDGQFIRADRVSYNEDNEKEVTAEPQPVNKYLRRK